MEHTLKSCLLDLHHIGAIQFGDFVLKSGMRSPIYIDLRLIVSYPVLLQQISNLIWKKVHEIPFDCICGVPYTALPIATLLSVNYHRPMIMRRKEVKEYGTKKNLEGVWVAGESCLVVEDLITTGASVLETVTPLEEQGLVVRDVVAFLDREQGGRARLEERGYRVHTVVTVTELLRILESSGLIGAEHRQEIQRFLEVSTC